MQTPFDYDTLDQLLADAGVDALVATTKHNLQRLLGGYRYFFFAHAEATGISRYLPALGLVKGRPDLAFYVGAGNEDWGTEDGSIWAPEIRNISWTSIDTSREVAELLKQRGLAKATIGVEKSFIPADALDTLREVLPEARFVEIHPVLETLRGVKTQSELELVRSASEGIIQSMDRVFAEVRPGATKHDIAEMFRRAQTDLGLYYEYALVTVGGSMNRSPSNDVWAAGTTLSLDSGGMYRGYIGDLSRMGIDSKPTPRMVSLLDQVEQIQQLARTAVEPGRRGADIYDVALARKNELPDGDRMKFVAHGMGLITHEVPRLTATGPIPYPATHAGLPLEPGMVLSIESWFEDADAGFIKMEDTLVVTDNGWEAPGDGLRGWNRTGGAH